MLFGGILQIPSTATEVRAAQIRVSGAGPSMKGKLLCPRWSSGGKNHSRLKSEQGLLTESPVPSSPDLTRTHPEPNSAFWFEAASRQGDGEQHTPEPRDTRDGGKKKLDFFNDNSAAAGAREIAGVSSDDFDSDSDVDAAMEASVGSTTPRRASRLLRLRRKSQAKKGAGEEAAVDAASKAESDKKGRRWSRAGKKKNGEDGGDEAASPEPGSSTGSSPKRGGWKGVRRKSSVNKAVDALESVNVSFSDSDDSDDADDDVEEPQQPVTPPAKPSKKSKQPKQAKQPKEPKPPKESSPRRRKSSRAKGLKADDLESVRIEDSDDEVSLPPPDADPKEKGSKKRFSASWRRRGSKTAAAQGNAFSDDEEWE